MPVAILRRPTDTSPRLAPVEPRYAPLFCFALLTAACALASFAFACATPFAAFAVIAAATLPLRPALLVTLAAWCDRFRLPALSPRCDDARMGLCHRRRGACGNRGVSGDIAVDRAHRRGRSPGCGLDRGLRGL